MENWNTGFYTLRIQGKFNMFCNLHQICNQLKSVSRFYEGKKFSTLVTWTAFKHKVQTIKMIVIEKNLCQWWNTCKNAPETKLWIKKIRILGENGINSKLKHRNAHNSILSGRFGDLYMRLEHVVISRTLLNNLGRVGIYVFFLLYWTNWDMLVLLPSGGLLPVVWLSPIHFVFL